MYRAKRVDETERHEMEHLLSSCGYNPAYAAILQREGMGYYELEDRLKLGPDGVGSLDYTHGIKPNWMTKRKNPLDPSAMGRKEAALAVGLIAGIIGLAVIFRSKSANAATKIGALAYTITESNAGSTVALHVGDTLNVNLSANTSAADYLASSSGDTAAMTQGTQVQNGSTMNAAWTATSTGSRTISYQAVDSANNLIGNSITFNITVSPAT